MCFYFPCLDSFFKKKEDIVCDDDGSMSSMPSLYDLHFSARMIGVNIVPNKAPHSFDTLVYTDDVGGDDIVVDLLNDDGGDGGIIGGDDVVDLLGGDYVVVDLLSCDDDDDGDKDVGGWFITKHYLLGTDTVICLRGRKRDILIWNFLICISKIERRKKIVVHEFLILGMIFGMVICMIRKIAMIMVSNNFCLSFHIHINRSMNCYIILIQL